MKKVVCASLLAFALLASILVTASAQVMIKDQAEYNQYTNAISLTDAKAKAAAIESFLQAYPQSVVREDMLQTLVLTYYSVPDLTKATDAADRLLQVNPNSLRGLTFEVFLRTAQAGSQTDPAQKQAMLDSAVTFAQRGLKATPPTGADAATATAFKGLLATATPTFDAAIAADAYAKKDYDTAIKYYLAELQSMPVANTINPQIGLQDTVYLADSYLHATTPDLLKCAFYAARAAQYAPDNFKGPILQEAQYCYKKYHSQPGSATPLDGYDTILAPAAHDNLTPPATMVITQYIPPKPEDLVTQVIKDTPDLKTLAISDREYALAFGTHFTIETPDVKPCLDATGAPAGDASIKLSSQCVAPNTPNPAYKAGTDSDKVWAVMNGVDGALEGNVVSATADSLQLSVSEDSVQNKTADFILKMKDPLKEIPEVGKHIHFSGVYTSFAKTTAADAPPVVITMTDGEIIPDAPAKKPAPVRRRPTTH